jgi:tetrapyrrole methylase family protein/MazG family protein
LRERRKDLNQRGLEKFTELVEIMARLRSKEGCPWDKKQTHESLKPYVVEEAYEVVEAIEKEDEVHLKEELGDLLLQVIFHAQIAKESGKFDIEDVLNHLIVKLKRRHPHVFGEAKIEKAKEVLFEWEKIKSNERGKESILAGIPKFLPSLLLALTIQDRAARVGFDWEKTKDIFIKLEEEVKELKSIDSAAEAEEEVGDILFTIVNIARRLEIDPEIALRKVCHKFEERFRFMEQEVGKKSQHLADLSLVEKDLLWEKAKKHIKNATKANKR